MTFLKQILKTKTFDKLVSNIAAVCLPEFICTSTASF